MHFKQSSCSLLFVQLILLLSLPPAKIAAQMVTGQKMAGFAQAFNLSDSSKNPAYTVAQIAINTASASGVNILWAHESARCTFKIRSTKTPIHQSGTLEVIAYQTSVAAGEMWIPSVTKLRTAGYTPIRIDIEAGGEQTVTLTPSIPERFGGYAMVFDIPGFGRQWAGAIVRTISADSGYPQFPTYALDIDGEYEETFRLFKRLGIHGARVEVGYFPTNSPAYTKKMERLRSLMKMAQENHVTMMITAGYGEDAPLPLGHVRPWLTADAVMKPGKWDGAWLPSSDQDFQEWCRRIAAEFGWPKGPLNAMELWNEPWEGISISGWGADIPRFREIYTHMAEGIVEARNRSGVKVLIGGACSTSNTRDKLFSDGKNTFLKWLDFVSIHYQPMAVDAALEPAWMNRKSAYGPVRIWDTESWVANSEDRVSAVIASMRAQGQSRTAGIYRGNVFTSSVTKADNQEYRVVHAWAPAAALAATQKFIGQRDFKQLLIKNGLPWVFEFDGMPYHNSGIKNLDDGTLLVVGDMGLIYERNRLLFRDVLGLQNREEVDKLKLRLAALNGILSPQERRLIQQQIKAASVLKNAVMTLIDENNEFQLFDFYGNPVSSKDGSIPVPLSGLGLFLRTNGAPGSFKHLCDAVANAEITGYEPISIIVKDFTSPVTAHPILRIELTNILNRPIHVKMEVSIGSLILESPAQTISLRPHETKQLSIKVTGGRTAADNRYPIRITADAGIDGKSVHSEELHVNWIAHRPIKIDGDLSDWAGALPQTMRTDSAIGVNMSEKAYLPFAKFDEGTASGLTTAYLAYDERFFYFASRISDSTPDAGALRFENRDQNTDFYPEISYADSMKKIALRWPDAVRRFSYRQDPELPCGKFANGGYRDNVQLAFNVIPPIKKSMRSNPPGTEPRFMTYPCTDYEFALNRVADVYGGGTEIWKLLSPGMPRKNFYPREPQSLIDGGPVKSVKLVMRRDGNMRIVECAIPWDEIPEVKHNLDAGQTIKFSFRVNDNGGPSSELAAERSVSKDDPLAFHVDWATHWATELEFGFEK